MSIQLLVADDHEVVRAGVRSFVQGTDIEVLAEAATAEQAAQLAAASRFDLVLLDVRMGHGDGLAALAQIKQAAPDLPVLMFTTYDNPAYVARAVQSGACGYVLKGSSRDKLLAAIRRAAAGELVWSSDQRRQAAATPAFARETDLEAPLTPRELDVLQWIAQGRTNKEIAQSLGISAETVKEHVQHMLRKLGVSDRTQAAVWAVRSGLAPADAASASQPRS